METVETVEKRFYAALKRWEEVCETIDGLSKDRDELEYRIIELENVARRAENLVMAIIHDPDFVA